MKRNDITALHSNSAADLTKKMEEIQVSLEKARIEKKVGKLKNPRLVSTLSDDLARVKSVLATKMSVGTTEETTTETKDKS